MKNIFIEGIQGMGKSTLLQTIVEKESKFHVCREGDYSPVELAWCAWMTEDEYNMMMERYGCIQREIVQNTVQEGKHYIVTYTKIKTDIPGFYKEFEGFEIYNGRRSWKELEEIVLSRYQRFCGTGYVFECAFMQNIVEDLILFHQLSGDEIVAFYHKLFATIQKENFLLLYLYSDKIEENIRTIQRERSDNQGNEVWYSLMMEYFVQSPYGRTHGCTGFEDLVKHFRHRQQVELRIIEEVVCDCARILPAKQWERADIENIS